LLVPAGQALEITHDLGGAVAKIDDAPWPGFPADMTSIALITRHTMSWDDPHSRKDV